MDEIVKESHDNKAFFMMRYAKNWILGRLASSLPVPSWRVGLHRMRGIKIGKEVFIGSDVIFDEVYPELITIEDYVELGDRCKLYAHSHGPALLKHLYPRITAPVKICKSAWVAPGCTILPGVTIGECSIVGADSVVTHSVEAYTIVAGSPAKLVKRLEEMVTDQK